MTICRLTDDVVNRIAAGEVIVRPSNAVKELIENSLDAEATEIIVTAENGGLDILKIQDNGKGIEKDDLPMVCERFATSKLHKFEDLENMSTFGFRGEALASLSLVSKVSIVSKTASANFGYIANYIDGQLDGDIRPSAGVDGTVVTAKQLFYNCLPRRQGLKYPSEEMKRIADVIIKYAIHYPNVTFTFRRCGSGSDFRTCGDGDTKKAIVNLLGLKLSTDLIFLNFCKKSFHFSMTGCLARPGISCTAQSIQERQKRQKTFLLFINGRSVECALLKKALDFVFANRNLICTFLLLSLKIEPSRVDVNVHPTKAVVYFLDQQAIVESIQEHIEEVLTSTFGECSLYSAAAIHDASVFTKSSLNSSSTGATRITATVSDSVKDPRPKSTKDSEKVYAHNMVRNDVKERTLDEFSTILASQSLSQVEIVQNPEFGSLNESLSVEATFESEPHGLTSVRSLKEKFRSSISTTLRTMFKDHIYIGAIDPYSILIQSQTAMYLIDASKCLKTYFYQILILSFGNFGSYKLEESAPLVDLLRLAKNMKEERAQDCANFLIENRAMLNELFCIQISEDGLLITVPSIIDGYIPQIESLPKLILSLMEDVDWDDEERCFDGICSVLAEFYLLKPEFCDFDDDSHELISWKQSLRDIVFPALKRNFLPSKGLEKYVRKIADLHELYKVFERC